ncbi:hypothetical protein Goari_001741, partial [Gossypium aridum]|nr:hypothetical protein [Gossypium aridum]
ILRNTKELKEKLKENLRNKSDFLKNGTITDQVRLGVAGWKKRYYKLKFSAETDLDIEITRKEIVCVLTMKSTLLYLDHVLFCYCNLVYLCRSKSTLRVYYGCFCTIFQMYRRGPGQLSPFSILVEFNTY